MSTLEVFFSILAASLYLVGFIPYIYHTFRGKVVPHAFSWTIWAILSSINTLALLRTDIDTFSLIGPGVRTIALVVGAIIAWYFIRKISIGWFDYLCLLLGVGCIGLAYSFGVERAIIPTIIVDIIVLAPTLKKLWANPDSEDAFTWFLVAASQACVVLSLPSYTLEASLYWTYVMSVNALVGIIIVRRRVYTHKWTYRLRSLISR